MNRGEPRDSQDRIEALLSSAEARASAFRTVVSLCGDPTPADQSLLLPACRELERHAVRRRHLPLDLASDNVWLILLDLFVGVEQGQSGSFSSTCERWGLSNSTAARYVAALIEAGLVVRRHFGPENRGFQLCLTQSGREIIRAILTQCD